MLATLYKNTFIQITLIVNLNFFRSQKFKSIYYILIFDYVLTLAFFFLIHFKVLQKRSTTKICWLKYMKLLQLMFIETKVTNSKVITNKKFNFAQIFANCTFFFFINLTLKRVFIFFFYSIKVYFVLVLFLKRI